jgi:hypothetical protein
VKASRRSARIFIPALIFLFLVSITMHAQQPGGSASASPIDLKSYAGMKWRLIGPFRGGRVLTVAGVPSQPNTYYFGAVAGGVWKTTDGGVSWDPLFEKQTTSSIGSIAVADPIPMSFTREPAKLVSAEISPSATACIVRMTPGKPGPMSD